jgi:hypothetical protein
MACSDTGSLPCYLVLPLGAPSDGVIQSLGSPEHELNKRFLFIHSLTQVFHHSSAKLTNTLESPGVNSWITDHYIYFSLGSGRG